MINLNQYITFLKKKSKFIVISIIVIGVVGFIYTKTLPPTYKSSINIYTNDPGDLLGYLNSTNAITNSFNLLPYKYKSNYSKSTLYLFLRNIKALQTGPNLVNLSISTNESNITKAWIQSFIQSIQSTNINSKMNFILQKDYESCLKSQKDAINAIKSSHLKINIPICSRVIFVQSVSKPSLITETKPSILKDTLITLIAGIFIVIAIASFIEYKND